MFLLSALPTLIIIVINFHEKYFILAFNLFRESYSSQYCLTNSVRLPYFGKVAYESFMYGSGYFLLPIYIIVE